MKNSLQPIKVQQRKGHNRKDQQIDISDHDALHFKSVQTLQIFKSSTIKRKPLLRETDTRFLSDLQKMIKLRQNKYLQLIANKKAELTPSEYDELDYRARIHGKANTINQNSKLAFEDINKMDRCYCGCRKGKGKLIPLLSDQQKLKSLGPGVLLQFIFTKAAAGMLIVVILIYCIYALLTNLIGSEAVVTKSCSEDLYCKFKQIISDENKPLTHSLHTVQSWLGLVYCIVWILLNKMLKYVGQERNRIIDEKLKSASDYAVKVQNLPRGKYEETQVISHIQELWKRKIKKQLQAANTLNNTINPTPQQAQDPNTSQNNDPYSQANITNLASAERKKFDLRIKSIQIIYNMQFSRKMSQEIFKIAQEVNVYLFSQDGGDTNRFLVSQYEDYLKAKEKLKETYELFKDLRKRFFNDGEFRKKLSTTCAIIQFQTQKTRRMVLEYFGAEKVGIVKQLVLMIKDCFSSNEQSVLFKGNVLKIQRAPEPSDILWTNCEQPQNVLRKIGIFLISLLIMLISFAIIFGLEMLKIYIKNNPDLIKVDIVLTIINYATSFALQIINAVFWQIMSALLDREYNHTKTQKIISLMNRVLVLSSINVIILPILSNYTTYKLYNNAFVYGNQGLSGLAFDYHVSSIVATLKKLLSISALIRTITVGFRGLRHKMIWSMCQDPSSIDFRKGDPNVNKFYEGDEFDIAENYIFIITSILHAAFFCKLQPIILFIIAVNICVFFFVNRVKILRFCKIPDMTEFLLFDTAVWMLGLVPIYYGTGSIVIAYLQNQQDKNFPFSLSSSIASFICIGIGLFGIANPGGVINRMLLFLVGKCQCIDIGEIMGEYEGGGDVEGFSDSVEEEDSSVAEEEKDKKNLNSRIESYYVNSNSLSLLGLEKVLKGEDCKTAFRELRAFCQKFFPKNKINNEPVTMKKFAQIVMEGKLEQDQEMSASKTDRQDN